MLIIKLHNITGNTTGIADYTYGVFVNDRRIANGRIEGHRRADGWQQLVAMMLEDAEHQTIRRHLKELGADGKCGNLGEYQRLPRKGHRKGE